MGAAAFLMAEYLQVPYAEVMVAAIIPALLYHSALFMQVDLESAKLGILGMPRERLPAMWQVLREGWHFLIPFAVLIYGLLGWNMEPEYAALVCNRRADGAGRHHPLSRAAACRSATSSAPLCRRAGR